MSNAEPSPSHRLRYCVSSPRISVRLMVTAGLRQGCGWHARYSTYSVGEMGPDGHVRPFQNHPASDRLAPQLTSSVPSRKLVEEWLMRGA
jgi:hypothetical protein